jgi:RNA polymerase sigma-70 factor (sigma-E family)
MLGGMSSGGFDPAHAPLAALYETQRVGLARLAFLLVDDGALAEELTQEAFARLYRRWSHLASPEAAPAYLRTTVVNLARSVLRRRALTRRHGRGSAATAASAEDDALAREAQRDMMDAVRRLPRRQRECVVLRYWADLTEAEIASTLGISAGSVKTHSHRALAALGRSLEAQHERR